MRAGRTDFGITTISRWMSRRRAIWATDLSWARAMPGEHGVVEEALSAFGERAPGLVLDAVLTHQLLVAHHAAGAGSDARRQG
ncbi:hypothetical protein [Streptomyces lincolnensis]|uniref:hypothetical protein n=1 Tax=Streptomyces lincolnensis TaxID=1915 RepID=UPI0035C171A5